MAITIDARNARPPGRAPSGALARVSQRARAFAAAQRHSRLVAALRIVLPLGALATLAVYVMVVAIAVKMDGSHLKVGAVEITADDLTMKDPSYFDFTKDGRYEVRAKRAVVGFNQKAPIKLIDVSGDLTQTSGTVTRLKAKHGLFESKKGELELFDGIEIDGTNGTMARLSRAMIYSKEGKVVSTDPVSATTPTGSVQAAAMTMYNKTRLVEFRGQVAVRMLPQHGQTLGIGKDARQPLDVRAAELDVDDAGKTAQFRGNVVAVQGESMLQAPSLSVKYEGKAAAAMTSGAEAPAAKEAGKDATRLTALSARNGVEITAGTDRHIASDSVDFDALADTAVFSGSVVATQDKNVLKGGRLLVDRKAGRSRLETPGDGGRISAKFHQNGAAATRQPKRQPAVEAVQETMLGSFKADRDAPMNVDADTLELLDTANKAIFTGDVVARQGDLVLRTAELTAFYSGQAGIGLTQPGGDAAVKGKGQEKSEVTRMEARHGVILTSKDQTATGKWADFNVKANTALLGGGITVTRPTDDPLKLDVIKGELLRVDLTTGISQVEASAAAPTPPQGAPAATKGPATSGSPVATSGATPAERIEACPPGRTCILLHPKQLKEKAMDTLKKRAPSVIGQ
jgi:LPS export ABC transporter protein LptC/lipopolysaccharide transport protein LptA